jgi:hypothetical protein
VSEAHLPADEERAFQEVVGLYDAPAYVRRARQVEGAYEELLARCRAQRDEWLGMVRLRVGQLFALAETPEVLHRLLADETQVRMLCEMHKEMAPVLRAPVEPTRSQWVLRAALQDLIESIERFSRRWEEYLRGIDVAPINVLREGYNRYYILEKECAMRSPAGARQGFARLEPLTREEVAALFPPLRVPRLG